ncbi:hypothetical protein G6L26_027765 (plasmid) [Agrobacterium radiobacter]|uniref:Ymd n=3 Tax=Agrobacterium tumefaciens TaxID=358 RepID=O52293_AGRTU|nr:MULTISPECIES: hypothetical protein [Rhizobium/Agrobacterium group]AAB91578.2 ymd [Agrobacterium tumefaciens]ASK41609.1 hypothetical protein [Agrobacterium tumefaciens]ASK42762.1 hypothetical protein [Agrobacterium sp.]ASK47096.1 hypothetical protein [Agrobacterium radiobacter]KWT81862.1 hypothetical protein ASB65_12830 [Agrobacterium tumefaciens str. B6]
MSEEMIGPSAEMLDAMGELWRLRPPAPDNILKHPAFVRLRDVCRNDYSGGGKAGPNFALSTALRSLGLPCHHPSATPELAVPVEAAAADLDAAFRATQSTRTYLAPLDLAADLPRLAFGSASVCRLKPSELRTLFDEPRLKRLYPRYQFDADRFAQFHWLVVQETSTFEHEPEGRAVPMFVLDFSKDLGRIEPHKGRFPPKFEEALFFLLLAPWEHWTTLPEGDWRGFRLPWVHTVDSDLFVRLTAPPSPYTLSWNEYTYDDGYGGTVEEERPVEFPLDDAVKTELPIWDQGRWAIVEAAKKCELFETPIVHFLVRAFLAEGIDEFLAHITTIEAALGLRADYQKSFRNGPDRHKRMRPTDRMRGRVAGLLGDRHHADQYGQLFDIRSAFLHGRTMRDISTQEQVMARSLARQVVEELILASKTAPVISRDDFLDGLLDVGATLI